MTGGHGQPASRSPVDLTHGTGATRQPRPWGAQRLWASPRCSPKGRSLLDSLESVLPVRRASYSVPESAAGLAVPWPAGRSSNP